MKEKLIRKTEQKLKKKKEMSKKWMRIKMIYKWIRIIKTNKRKTKMKK